MIHVIGGAGYLGRELCIALAQYEEVVCVDPNIYNVDPEFRNRRIQYKEIRVQELNEDIDKLVWMCDIDIPEFYDTNTGEQYIEEQYSQLSRLIKKTGNSLILCDIDNGRNFKRYNEYENAKKCLGKYLEIGTVFGCSHRMRFDTTINDFVFRGLMTEKFNCYNWNDWITVQHIDNVIENIVSIIVGSKRKEFEYCYAPVSYYVTLLASLFSIENLHVAFASKNDLEILDNYVGEDKRIILNRKTINSMIRFVEEAKECIERNNMTIIDVYKLCYSNKETMMNYLNTQKVHTIIGAKNG